MFRFKTPHLFLLLGLIASADSFAANLCIATAGGASGGGADFIAPTFAVPAEGDCTPWAGFTKTATTVIQFASGTVCLSTNGLKLTVSVASADPTYLGTVYDYIQLTRPGTTGSFHSGTDNGTFGGSAVPVTCTTSLLHLYENHD